MKIFKVNKRIEIVCQSEGTRYGFRHLATLMLDGREVDSAKACYYNRTWERFPFESVMENLAEKQTFLTPAESRAFRNKIRKWNWR